MCCKRRKKTRFREGNGFWFGSESELEHRLGGVFGGSIMTEIIFGYPGVGTLIQNAILQSDYNMILGCITISIVAISTATLVVDLIYPFIDPRIRYG